MMGRIKHEPNFPALYAVFGSYKELAEFYSSHLKMKSEEEIRARIQYVLKHKLKQMNELETLKWVLGESIIEENYNETKNIT